MPNYPQEEQTQTSRLEAVRRWTTQPHCRQRAQPGFMHLGQHPGGGYSWGKVGTDCQVGICTCPERGSQGRGSTAWIIMSGSKTGTNQHKLSYPKQCTASVGESPLASWPGRLGRDRLPWWLNPAEPHALTNLGLLPFHSAHPDSFSRREAETDLAERAGGQRPPLPRGPSQGHPTAGDLFFFPPTPCVSSFWCPLQRETSLQSLFYTPVLSVNCGSGGWRPALSYPLCFVHNRCSGIRSEGRNACPRGPVWVGFSPLCRVAPSRCSIRVGCASAIPETRPQGSNSILSPCTILS
ncbi:hypothetical protein H1C71_000141 [Ictidomys tridecemlineatus]|nr:hypothetical protein H1C71_000141 [Ictidomys tridecemlineatus]